MLGLEFRSDDTFAIHEPTSSKATTFSRSSLCILRRGSNSGDRSAFCKRGSKSDDSVVKSAFCNNTSPRAGQICMLRKRRYDNKARNVTTDLHFATMKPPKQRTRDCGCVDGHQGVTAILFSSRSTSEPHSASTICGIQHFGWTANQIQL